MPFSFLFPVENRLDLLSNKITRGKLQKCPFCAMIFVQFYLSDNCAKTCAQATRVMGSMVK